MEKAFLNAVYRSAEAVDSVGFALADSYNFTMSNQKGFTLSELITGAALMSIVMLGVASVMFFMNYTYLSKKDRMEAEEAAAKAEWLLKMVFSQAIDLTSTTAGNVGTMTSITNVIGAGASGEVAVGTFDRIAGGQWMKLAAFQREAQASIPGVAAKEFGALVRTAIFFRRPEAPPTNTTGVLFFDMGVRNPAGAPPAATIMAPSYADDWVPRISYLQIIPTSHQTYNTRLTSLEFRIAFRYHDQGNQQTTWCPRQNLTGGAAVIAACNPAGVMWHDIDRRFTVLLRNNWLRQTGTASRAGTAGGLEERVLGNLYFFEPVIPDRNL